MHEFGNDPQRMTEEEAHELMRRLSATEEEQAEAKSLPSILDIASLLNTDASRVQRELEILRHEARIQELERQRQEEESLLRRMRADRVVEQEASEDEAALREARKLRQERMELWAQRESAETVEDSLAPRRRSVSKVAVVILLIVAFLLLTVLLPSTRTIERSAPTPPPRTTGTSGP